VYGGVLVHHTCLCILVDVVVARSRAVGFAASSAGAFGISGHEFGSTGVCQFRSGVLGFTRHISQKKQSHALNRCPAGLPNLDPMQHDTVECLATMTTAGPKLEPEQ
jgi:hypothetical protein